jgi:hypothetical protein
MILLAASFFDFARCLTQFKIAELLHQ